MTTLSPRDAAILNGLGLMGEVEAAEQGVRDAVIAREAAVGKAEVTRDAAMAKADNERDTAHEKAQTTFRAAQTAANKGPENAAASLGAAKEALAEAEADMLATYGAKLPTFQAPTGGGHTNLT